jgi:hypothetical protein
LLPIIIAPFGSFRTCRVSGGNCQLFGGGIPGGSSSYGSGAMSYGRESLHPRVVTVGAMESR